MSFGWGAGDIVLAIQLCKEIYDALTSSTEEYHAFAVWLRSLIATLELFQIYEKTKDDSLNTLLGSSYTPQEESQLKAIVHPLKINVDNLLATLKKYLQLGDKPEKTNVLDWFKRQGKKLKWKFLEAEDLQTQKNSVSDHLGMLHAVVSARASRNEMAALSSISDSADANQRSVTRYLSDANKTASLTQETVMKILNVISNSLLASGEVPNMLPAVTGTTTGSTSDAKSVLKLLEQQIPTASFRPSYDVDASVKIGGFTRGVFESWLPPQTKQPCLWIVDKRAAQLSETVAAVRRDLNLPVVYYHCEKLGADGKFIEPEQILSRMSYSVLHQLLCYIVSGQLPMPERLEIEDYKDLDKDPKSCTGIIGLANSLVTDSSRLVWVIDGFERLEDDRRQHSEFHGRGVEKLLTLVGVGKSIGVTKSLQPTRRCLIATTVPSIYLGNASRNEHIRRYAPGDRAEPERYALIDEIKGMMLWEKNVDNG